MLVRALPAAACAAGVCLVLIGCTGPAPEPSASPVTVTTTVTPPGPGASAEPSDSAAADAGRPRGQCADAALTVDLGAEPGSAGTLRARVVFTNGGATACVLRGAPGVSVVGHGDGTQIGVPAARDQSGAHDVELAAHGGQAHADLTMIEIRKGVSAPKGCRTVLGDGYRVYPPHSTRAFFVREDEVYACSGSPVFLHVGVVSPGAGTAG